MAVTSRVIISNILGLIGAVAGGVLGYYIFMWIVDQGFYGLMIPGALLGPGLRAAQPACVADPRVLCAPLRVWCSGCTRNGISHRSSPMTALPTW